MLASASEHSHLSDRTSDVCTAQAEPSRLCTLLPQQHLSCTEPQYLSSWSEPLDDPARNFECNSCMRLACDPVVTMCGHLFCWPCLYRHLSLHSSCQQCPVCNVDVRNRIVPLYGCGRMADASTDCLPEKARGVHLPSRPTRASTRSVSVADTTHANDHGSEPADLSAVQQSALIYAPIDQRFGMADSPALQGRRLVLLRRGRRFSNEKVFVLHWVFICVGLIASGWFLLASS